MNPEPRHIKPEARKPGNGMQGGIVAASWFPDFRLKSRCSVQPFTAPLVRPEMNSRCSNRKRNITGAMETRVPAMIKL